MTAPLHTGPKCDTLGDMDTAAPPLSPTEAATLLGVDVGTLKRWARDGKVPGAWRTPGGWWKFPREGLEQLALPRSTTVGA
jgi:excisionase family DNA binding protein